MDIVLQFLTYFVVLLGVLAAALIFICPGIVIAEAIERRGGSEIVMLGSIFVYFSALMAVLAMVLDHL